MAPADSPPPPGTKIPTGIDLYARFALAGALGCAVTHGALTPVDVVKTRMQLEPTIYNKGMFQSMKQIVKSEGWGALATGLGPTAVGYFAQGAFKFGGYEFWKKTAVETLGVEAASRNREAIYLGASALAEFGADLVLCPLEATRIRLVSQPTFAKGLFDGFSRIAREEGVLRGFYSGLIPILFKQIPYTMTKFVVFEKAFEAIIQADGTPKELIAPGKLTGYNLLAGLTSGVCAAIISQPADTLLSKMNKQKGAEGESMVARLAQFSRQLGIRGLFLGLGARVIMVGTLTAGQFAIYSDIKRMLNAVGGVEIAKIPTIKSSH